MRFNDDEHREAVVERLHRLGKLADGELVEDDEGVRLVLDADDSTAALARAKTIVRGALDGTDMDPAGVECSAGAGWGS